MRARRSISDHARALKEVLENLPSHTELRFVGHSMGNIVVRHLIADLKKDDPKKYCPAANQWSCWDLQIREL